MVVQSREECGENELYSVGGVYGQPHHVSMMGRWFFTWHMAEGSVLYRMV